jgi:amino acid transporter
MTFTYLRFRKALQAQGISRDSLPHKGFWQPFCAYYALTGTFIMTFVGGYPVFLAGHWDIPTFLFSYTMIAVFPILFVFWKLFRRTRFLKPEEVDLREGLEEIEDYQRNYVPTPAGNMFNRFLDNAFS